MIPVVRLRAQHGARARGNSTRAAERQADKERPLRRYAPHTHRTRVQAAITGKYTAGVSPVWVDLPAQAARGVQRRRSEPHRLA
eukprot:2361554-Prymnesium_polylepis.3